MGSRTLADMWAKGIGPHIGFAYSKDRRHVIRGSYARSFGSMVSVSGSTHAMGFTLTQGFNNSTTGVVADFHARHRVCRPGRRRRSSIRRFRTGRACRGSRATKRPNCRRTTTLRSRFSASWEARWCRGDRVQRRNGIAPANAVACNTTTLDPSYLTAFGTVAQSVTVLNSLVGSALPRTQPASRRRSRVLIRCGARAIP